jgi:hypothetical protein
VKMLPAWEFWLLCRARGVDGAAGPLPVSVESSGSSYTPRVNPC